MRKTFKKTMCLVLSSALIVTSGDFSFVNIHNPFDFSFSVEAVKNITESDETEVTTAIVKDTALLNALKKIIGNGGSFTVGKMKNFTGAIDLSSYTGINSLVGLGYAKKASSFNLSKQTGVKTIAREEFFGCAMTSVTLPSSLTEIEPYAFAQCSNLKTINMPESLVKIDENVFEDCESLTDAGTTGGLKLPSKLIKLGSASFSGCKSIKSAVLPNTLSASIDADDTTINTMGTSVFSNCSSLSSVTLGTSMTKIPAATFSGCTSLTGIAIDSRFDEIGANAFANSGLLSVNLGSCTKLTNIGESAFSNCHDMTTVSLPACLRIIKAHVFAGSTALTTVNIPANNNIQSIGNDAFSGLYSMKKVTFMKNMKQLTSIGEMAFAGGSVRTDSRDAFYDYIYLGGPEEIYVPENVIEIGQSAFAENRNLKKFEMANYAKTIDGTITRKIGNCAFQDDWNLNYVTLPEQNNSNVKMSVEIGSYAFDNCNRLREINFPTCLTKIGAYGFSACGFGKKNRQTGEFVRDGLKDVDLSKNTRCVDIGEGAFQKCCNLYSLKFPSNLKAIPNKVLYQACAEINKGTHQYVGLETVDLGKSAITIGEQAFAESRCLVCTDDTLPNTLTKIGKQAFFRCSMLGALAFPESLVEIGESAFDEAAYYDKILDYNYTIYPGSGLKSIKFEKAKNIKTIGKYAFRYTPITKVVFDSSAPLDSIRTGTFYGCTDLKTVTLSDAVEDVMSNALGACSSLENLSIYQTTILDAKVCQNVNKTHPTTKNAFAFKIRVPSSNITVRVNEHDEMTIYPLVFDSVAGYDTKFNTVTIDNKKFVWDDDNKGFTPPSGYESLAFTPSVEPSEKKTNGSGTKYNVQGLLFQGNKEQKDIAVQVGLFLALPTTQVNDGVVGLTTISTSVEYKVNVAKVPCESITCNDAHISVANQTEAKATTVTPNIYPKATTDLVKWEILDGAEKVEMKVADDGRSAKFWSTGAGYGTTRVKLTAGSVTQEFCVYVVAPAKSMKVEPKKVNVPYNDTRNLTATITYDKTYADDYAYNPDSVRFVSDNENVVKIKKVTSKVGSTVSSGNTYTAELEAVNIGKANISVYLESSEWNSNFKPTVVPVSVVASNITMTLVDVVDDVRIVNGTTTTLYKANSNTHKGIVDKSSKTYVYDFSSDDISSSEIEYIIDDENICKIEGYSAEEKTFNIKGKHAGKTDVTIFPKGFDAAVNGITFTVAVTADVKGITMKNKTVKSGQVEYAFSSIVNTYGDKVSEGSVPYSTITNNTLEFKSSNTNIATVDKNGVVKVKNVGPVEVTCTAYASDGTEIANAICTLTCKVGVNDLSISKVSNQVYTGKDIKPAVVVKRGNKVLVEGRDYSITYRDCRRVGKASITIKCKGDYDGSIATYFNILPRKVTNLRQLLSGKNTAITWTKVDEAEGYEVFNYAGKKYSKLGSTKSIKFVLKKLKKFKTYKIAVRTYAKGKDGKVYYGDYKVISVTPGMTATKIKKLKAGKKKVTIKWKKLKGVSGYEVYMSTKKTKGFKKITTIKKAKKIKFTKKKLKSKKTYYFKVRAFKKIGKAKVYGPFSKVKSVKVK